MKTILFSILILFSINGFAFNWKKVTESGSGNSYYVDVDNIKKHNRLIYYFRLDDYLEWSSDGINSKISKIKVNCLEEKQTFMDVTSYSRQMGRGRILVEHTPNVIQYPKPDEVGHTVMKFICNY